LAEQVRLEMQLAVLLRQRVGPGRVPVLAVPWLSLVVHLALGLLVTVGRRA
jgi:hypothetical protein